MNEMGDLINSCLMLARCHVTGSPTGHSRATWEWTYDMTNNRIIANVDVYRLNADGISTDKPTQFKLGADLSTWGDEGARLAAAHAMFISLVFEAHKSLSQVL